MTTKCFAIEAHGFDGFRLSQREAAVLGAREVRVRMRAMALNYRDVEILLGTYHTSFKHPLVPLSDGVGAVIEAGADVTRVKPGDRVAMAFWERWTDGAFRPTEAGAPLGGPKDGVLAEHFDASEERLVIVPDGLSDLEAAGLPCAATTSWNALMVSGHLMPGETVLVQGTGGVALSAVQIALMAGARPIVTSSSDAKLERVKCMGAAGTINYRRTPQLADEVLRLTGGRGVDHVIEVGGPGTFHQSLESIRSGGHINVIGYLGGVDGAINPLDIFRRQATVRGIPVGLRRMLEQVMGGQAGRVQTLGPLRPTFHVDSHQSRPGWKGKSEGELNALRQLFADMVLEVGGLVCGYNVTVFPDTLEAVPEIVAWAERNIDRVHYYTLTVLRLVEAQAPFDYYAGGRKIDVDETVYYSATPYRKLMSPEVRARVARAAPDLRVSAFLGGTVRPEALKLALSVRLATTRESFGSLGPRSMELMQSVHHWFRGRYLAFARPSMMRMGRSACLLGLFGRIFVLGGLTKALDVIAHELTHGVTEFTAGLEYHTQPGALNEHFSDTLGSLVKQYSLGQTADQADWLIGEGTLVPTLGKALRYR